MPSLRTLQLGVCGSVAGIAFSTSTRIVHADSPGCASHGISHSSVLNSQARLKIKKYKVAAEERRATFCPLIIITVDGVAHASFQAFLRHVSAQLFLG